MGLQASMRAAAVTLLTEYGADANIKLSVYRSRPVLINPPHAWVDKVSVVIDNTTALSRQRPVAEVVVVHGIFNYGESVDQRDAFMDGFLSWVTARVHAAGPNSTIGVTDMDDDPDYQADWSDTETRTFYATRIQLEGYGLVET